jgi:hypothetical protein
MEHRILVFTVHKAASLGLFDVMRRVAKKEGWPLHSANLKKADIVEPETPGDKEFYGQIENMTGFIGPIRTPVFIPAEARKRDRFILHLRDPRDVLVSMFYSWGFSHPGVDPDYRNSVREKGIDEFAVKNSRLLNRKYRRYVRKVLPLEHTTFLRYEDFVGDRPRWLEGFLKGAGITDGLARYQDLANENPAASVREEDKKKHIRKAEPGDYREKLSPETIAELNERFAEVLKALGYAK